MFFGCREPSQHQLLHIVKVGWREGKALGSEERRALESGLLCDMKQSKEVEHGLYYTGA
jgi:hypothetical protein